MGEMSLVQSTVNLLALPGSLQACGLCKKRCCGDSDETQVDLGPTLSVFLPLRNEPKDKVL